ncbi:hypothetical protein BZA77DRAFT_373285 [Pyronema omphalodes]|nr:hypothetical protein BZA77DRAFT_373285 [Pyronema omphalodes]
MYNLSPVELPRTPPAVPVEYTPLNHYDNEPWDSQEYSEAQEEYRYDQPLRRVLGEIDPRRYSVHQENHQYDLPQRQVLGEIDPRRYSVHQENHQYDQPQRQVLGEIDPRQYAVDQEESPHQPQRQVLGEIDPHRYTVHQENHQNDQPQRQVLGEIDPRRYSGHQEEYHQYDQPQRQVLGEIDPRQYAVDQEEYYQHQPQRQVLGEIDPRRYSVQQENHQYHQPQRQVLGEIDPRQYAVDHQEYHPPQPARQVLGDLNPRAYARGEYISQPQEDYDYDYQYHHRQPVRQVLGEIKPRTMDSRLQFTPTPHRNRRVRDMRPWNAAFEQLYGPPPVFTLHPDDVFGPDYSVNPEQHNPLHRPENRHPDDVFGPDYSVNPEEAEEVHHPRIIPSQTLPYPFHERGNDGPDNSGNPRVVATSRTLPMQPRPYVDYEDYGENDHEEDIENDDYDNRTVYPASIHTVVPSKADLKVLEPGLEPENRQYWVDKKGNEVSLKHATSNQRLISSQTLPVYKYYNNEDDKENVHVDHGINSLGIDGETHRNNEYRINDYGNTKNGRFYPLDNIRMISSHTLPIRFRRVSYVGNPLYSEEEQNVNVVDEGKGRYDRDGLLIDSDEETFHNPAEKRLHNHKKKNYPAYKSPSRKERFPKLFDITRLFQPGHLRFNRVNTLPLRYRQYPSQPRPVISPKRVIVAEGETRPYILIRSRERWSRTHQKSSRITKVYPLRSVQNESFKSMTSKQADEFIENPGCCGLHEFRIFNQVIVDHWAKKQAFDWHLPFFGDRAFDKAMHALRRILNNALAGKRDSSGLQPWSRVTKDSVDVVYAVMNEVIASAYDSPGGHARCRNSFVAA